MKIAVIGGTGMTGRRVVERVSAQGHEPVVISRANVDMLTGVGVDAALAGVQRIIDVTHSGTLDEAQSRQFFSAVATHLTQAAARAGVEGITVLSIIGVDRFASGYYLAKREQEQITQAGSVPARIVRSAQFHEYAGQALGWGRQGDQTLVPIMPVQPIALIHAADRLVTESVQPQPATGIGEIAGPQPEALVDMVERLVRHRGESVTVVPQRTPGAFGDLLAGGVFLPAAGAYLAGPTFQTWLEAGETTTL